MRPTTSACLSCAAARARARSAVRPQAPLGWPVVVHTRPAHGLGAQRGSGARVCSHSRACRSAERAHARAAGVPRGRDGPARDRLPGRLLPGRQPAPSRCRRPGRPGAQAHPTLPYSTSSPPPARAARHLAGSVTLYPQKPSRTPPAALARPWHLQSLLFHALSCYDSPELLYLARPSRVGALHRTGELGQRGQRGQA